MSQQKDPEVLEIPGAEGISVDFFKNLMTQAAPTQQIPGLEVGPAQQIPGLQVGPAQRIAGMSGAEQTTQALLSKFLGTSATGGEAYKLGMGEIQKTLGGEAYDPRTSDFWKGFREVSAMEQEKGVSDIRRRGQLGGGLYGEPGMRAEAEYIRGAGAERQMMLGGLYEKERERKTGAVGQALGYAGFGEQGALSRLRAGTEIGALPRQLEQARYGAEYTQEGKRSQAAYEQQFGQSAADFARQQAAHQATYQQQLGQTQADYASALTEIAMQTGAAKELMPQWSVPGEQADPLGGFLGIIGSILGGK